MYIWQHTRYDFDRMWHRIENWYVHRRQKPLKALNICQNQHFYEEKYLN